MILYKDLPDELTHVSNVWGALMVSRTWLVILLAMGLAGASASLVSWIAALVLIGLMQYHLSVLGHHAMHKNLFSIAQVNETVARLFLLAPQGMTLPGARSNHMRHHTLFQMEGDYELDNYDLRKGRRDTRWGLLQWIGGAYLGGALIPAVRRVLKGEAKAAAKRSTSVFKELAIVAAIQGLIFITTYAISAVWYSYFVLWLLPLFTLTVGLSVTRATLEHADLGEPPHRLMTFPADPIQRFIWGPFNFNWHAEHHLFPGVPACNLEKLHHYIRRNNPDIMSGDTPIKIVPSYMHRLKELLEQCRDRRSAAAARIGPAAPS